ncbi:phospholipase D family protein [Macrococcoides caseolyticum]|uniref:phospholipase D family protein n=1 Tax=Macrococcoides caseolyticum TaxID=69966 RepID=UPI001F41A096|nr:phospholipase D family protein [Macrococcus caseolyticus]MCE4955948.1 phospholipase D family protein [Macrococcus caseolyticus]
MPAKKSKVVSKPRSRKQPVKKKKLNKKKKLGFKKIALICFGAYIVCAIYGTMKPLPGGVSKWFDYSKTNDAQVLLDNTYQKGASMHYEHEIFTHQLQAIRDAEDFIILDMFLFNNTYDGEIKFPNLTEQLTNALITKKQENPKIRIFMLTDPINSFYGSYTPDHYKKLRANGIHLYETNLVAIRDSNPVYSGLWRPTMRWFGNNENGLIKNIFSENAPNVTVRGFGRLLNMKANHRKTLVTEKTAIVSSSNPHDPSGHHQNVALKVSGQIQEDLINSEIHAMNMSGANLKVGDFKINHRAFNNTMNYTTTLVTEGKIKAALIEQIGKMGDSDSIKMGMFYLSDRDIIQSLINASKRGVDVQLILDVNKEAFGKEKPGIPNKPVAHELIARSDDNIKIKWAVSHGEQYHAKFTLLRDNDKNESTLLLGSANLTRRNVGDLNLETDVMISGKADLPVFTKIDKDFDAKWNNTYAHVTDYYDVKKDPSFWKTVLYRVQEFSGLSSF